MCESRYNNTMYPLVFSNVRRVKSPRSKFSCLPRRGNGVRIRIKMPHLLDI
jgi:hypothetical protein